MQLFLLDNINRIIVSLSICPSVRLYVRTSVHPCVRANVRPYICVSVCLTVFLSVCFSLCSSLFLSHCGVIYPSLFVCQFRPSVSILSAGRVPVCVAGPPVRLSYYLSLGMSVYANICPLVHLSVTVGAFLYPSLSLTRVTENVQLNTLT